MDISGGFLFGSMPKKGFEAAVSILSIKRIRAAAAEELIECLLTNSFLIRGALKYILSQISDKVERSSRPEEILSLLFCKYHSNDNCLVN